MRLSLAALFLATSAFAATTSITPLPSLGEPALSPDNSEIAFVSGGDIWTVPAKGGEARLLVSHPATEMRPLYSPDGSMLAFTSTRTGNGDIYVLALATGQLTRLTYSDTMDLLDGWSRDGKWLYFSSGVTDIGGDTDILRVSVNGGTPLEVTRERFYNELRGAPSPNGTELAFVAKGFSGNQWWRHGHSHIDESEIWIKGLAEKAGYRRIVEEDAKQGWPMWSADGKALFYTSDRTGAENVFRQSLEAKSAPKQLTQFKDGRLLWPSISYDGREIVFERDFRIWKLDTRSGSASEVSITLRGSPATPAVAHRTFSEFSDLALSPDGKKVAIIAHGDVFAASASDGGDATRLTRTPAPETDVHWSPDSNRAVYVSTRNGSEQIFEYDIAKSKESQLTDSKQDDESPTYSPDGKLIAFVRAHHELHVFAIDGRKDQTVATGDLFSPALAWSPDSKYLAYTAVGAKSFRNVYVVSADGNGTGQPVSFLANGETATRIAWSPDGKYLLFDTAQRSELSQIARVDLVPHVPKFREDQFRELFKTEPALPERTTTTNPEKQPSKTSELSSGQLPAAEPSKNATTPAKKTEPTRIVFDGIRQRLTFVPLGYDCGPPIISPDGKTLVFAARAGEHVDLYDYSLDELASMPPTVHQLTTTGTRKASYEFSPDSKQIYFLDADHVVSLPLDTHAPKTIPVSAALDVDFDEEKIAAFNQGWKLLDQLFFDPRFRGQDWNHLHDEYAPYIAGSHTPDEMRRVMSLMIGELNASHSGISGSQGPSTPANPFSPTPTPIGVLGLRFEREPYEAGRGLMIREVIPLGPAAIEGTIKPGETLVSVDGEPVGPHTNVDSLLQNKVDRRVVLQIGAASNPSQTREAIVRPIALRAEQGLAYRAWVEDNRAYVDRVSGGKLGYVHMADMTSQSLNQLYIDLDVQNQTKQGVIIDIRDNHGGFVNEYAIDVFTRKNYLTMTPRWGSPSPARSFLGQRALGLPTILVTNQGSLSDAEDFTEGYRTLKLGKVVGEPTAGWIIYTDGTQLVDGSVLRLPEIRVQGANGDDMELHPRPVDIFIERMPGESKDVQLDRAVATLLGELGR